MVASACVWTSDTAVPPWRTTQLWERETQRERESLRRDSEKVPMLHISCLIKISHFHSSVWVFLIISQILGLWAHSIICSFVLWIVIVIDDGQHFSLLGPIIHISEKIGMGLLYCDQAAGFMLKSYELMSWWCRCSVATQKNKITCCFRCSHSYQTCLRNLELSLFKLIFTFLLLLRVYIRRLSFLMLQVLALLTTLWYRFLRRK